MSLTVSDIEVVAAWLQDRGVVFEQYDGLEQRGGITTGAVRSGWFRDSEGNLIGLVQEPG